MYVADQDILNQAYYELREDYAKNDMSKSAKDFNETNLKEIKTAYPFKISEAETWR